MAGIYVHIPFCKRACHYCNFHFSTSVKQLDAMIHAICREADLRHQYINESVRTIYFGGGTPSLLTIYDLRFMIDCLKNLFEIDKDAEITIEANPDDITEEKLDAWKVIGINRLSIGVQSFFQEDLEWMNRVHSAEQALRCVQIAQQAGFVNITIDLIYGMPSLPNDRWKQNIDTALSLNIPHLSCYALTIEPKTALEKMIASKKAENVDLDKQSFQFELLMKWMEEAGYEHYEISNFAKSGYRSKHNSSYWQGKHYLGLGPSAHSFNGNTRQWNIANNSLYIKSVEQNIIPCEIEELTIEQQLNEYIMTSLRTMEGLSLTAVSKNWSNEAVEKIMLRSKKFIQRKVIFEEDDHLILTKKGKLFADGIAADLFSLSPEKSKIDRKQHVQ